MASRMPQYDLLRRRADHFSLWNPGSTSTSSAPSVVLGTHGAQGNFIEYARGALSQDATRQGLWELSPSDLSPSLQDNTVYHYWFDVQGVRVTDPFAYAVDYAHVKDRSEPPPGIIKYRDGKLWACDLDGTEPAPVATPALNNLASNNHLVIYELPTSWAKPGNRGQDVDVDVGTFADVRALFDAQAPGDKFASISTVRQSAILAELGINALELLPAADARAQGEWGYATAHYFAPDYDLGSASQLAALAETIHGCGVRLFTDVVMAFGHDPYGTINFKQFHINPKEEPENPDSYQSHAYHQERDGWGGMLWRYIQNTDTYDPETGQVKSVHPAWAFHRGHLTRWMSDFGVGGLRLDSVNNIGNWDFVQSYKKKAWELYNARYGSHADPSKFLVIGEELSMPLEMVHQGVLDALWNEHWQSRLRATLVGESWNDSFEWTVRKLVDCTLDGFGDGAQAVNYITSHDIEGGDAKCRLYDFCEVKHIWDKEQRFKLAFVLLLTSVGVPMIFAGEEFADQQDRSRDMRLKQTDPVNYSRKDDGGWRQALFAYVANLVKFRTHCPALGVDDTDFFHVDQSRGGKIMAWSRGATSGPFVVVVANFTDSATPGSEYFVPNWPQRSRADWREVTEGRDVPMEWVGREPLMAWQAKVYTFWKQ